MSNVKIGVVGAGTMGNGIAHVFAAAGFDVVLNDLEQAFVDRGLATIDKNLQRGVDKGRMTAEEKAAILGRIRTSADLDTLADRDLVVEAIMERLDVKTALFEKLDIMLGSRLKTQSSTTSKQIQTAILSTKRLGVIQPKLMQNHVSTALQAGVISTLLCMPPEFFGSSRT